MRIHPLLILLVSAAVALPVTFVAVALMLATGGWSEILARPELWKFFLQAYVWVWLAAYLASLVSVFVVRGQGESWTRRPPANIH